MSYLYLPFAIQGFIMALDERLHVKRGLGWWERLGHPLDTLTVFIPLVFIWLNSFNDENLMSYVLLSIFSCLFITKDEFIHAKECSGFEKWLHSLLFIIHPMIFLCAALLWKSQTESRFLFYQMILVGLFLFYQILRWSIPWEKLQR